MTVGVRDVAVGGAGDAVNVGVQVGGSVGRSSGVEVSGAAVPVKAAATAVPIFESLSKVATIVARGGVDVPEHADADSKTAAIISAAVTILRK